MTISKFDVFTIRRYVMQQLEHLDREQENLLTIQGEGIDVSVELQAVRKLIADAQVVLEKTHELDSKLSGEAEDV